MVSGSYFGTPGSVRAVLGSAASGPRATQDERKFSGQLGSELLISVLGAFGLVWGGLKRFFPHHLVMVLFFIKGVRVRVRVRLRVRVRVRVLGPF